MQGLVDYGWFDICALLVGGFFAGVVNTLAGAGSLINLPLLSMVGLPHTLANATNRVAVVVQTGVAAIGYTRSGYQPWDVTRPLILPVLAGSGLGAWLATILSDRLFRPIVGTELVILAGLLLFKPELWINPAPGGKNPSPLKRTILFVFIGIYAGFIQAAVGFFLIATLVRQLGLDLVRANGVKGVLTLAATILSLGIFLSAGMIRWGPGLILALGNGVGGWVGAHLAVRKGAGWIRWVLVATVTLSALEIFGVYGWIARQLGW